MVVKAETQGALEAFIPALEALSSEKGRIKIIYAGLSVITEADIMLAAASRAIILGFKVKADKAAVNAAQIERVPIMMYDIIYHALEDVSEFLESETEQFRVVGEAKVLEVFELSNGTHIAGSRIVEGYLVKGGRVQVVRDNEIIVEGRITSLRQGKDPKNKVEDGECGIELSQDTSFLHGDVILMYSS